MRDVEIHLLCPVWGCDSQGMIHADSTDFPDFSVESIENEGNFVARCKKHEAGGDRG